MATYNGIMAGIGDIVTGDNVIQPEFDAAVNNFIIGQNGVISGFNIINNTLTAGMCIAQGYRGSIDADITLDAVNYVYGVFKVYHDPEILDEFYIETSATPLGDNGGNSYGDDILESAGTYHLLLNEHKIDPSVSSTKKTTIDLYLIAVRPRPGSTNEYQASITYNFTDGSVQNVTLVTQIDETHLLNHVGNTINLIIYTTEFEKEFNVQVEVEYQPYINVSLLKYPLNAVNADNSSHLVENGTIGDGTTAVTQAVNDNSTKVATTAYVHAQIEEEIGYVTNTISYFGPSGSSSQKIGEIQFSKKANYIIAVSKGTNTNYRLTSNDNFEDIKFTIPNSYLPKTANTYYFIAMPVLALRSVSTAGLSMTCYLLIFQLTNTGSYTLFDSKLLAEAESYSSPDNIAYTTFLNTTAKIGWE